MKMNTLALKDRLGRLGRVLSKNTAIEIALTTNEATVAYTDGKRIVINPSNPAEPNETRAMISQKAKLYHELGHVLFTTHSNLRADMRRRMPHHLASQFDAVSNILEDGRIERLMAKHFIGTKPYFAYLLTYFPCINGDAGSELIHFVRSGKFQTSKVEAIFQPFRSKLDYLQTHKATTKYVLELASEIVYALNDSVQIDADCYKHEPVKPSDNEDQEDQDQDQDQDQEDQDQDQEDQDQEDQDQEDQDQEDQDQEDQSESERNRIAELLEAEIAIDIELCSETIANGLGVQPLKDSNEMAAATRLTSVLKTIESNGKRIGFVPARQGNVDSRRIVNAVTGGRLLRSRSHIHDKRPAVCLLVDVSISMNYVIAKRNSTLRIESALSAGRVLNAAIKNADLHCSVLTFGSVVRPFGECVPINYRPTDSSTLLGPALQAANKIFLDRDETRKLCIVVTDGELFDVTASDVTNLKSQNVTIVGIDVTGRKGSLDRLCDFVVPFGPDTDLSFELTNLVSRFVQ